jgi:hypothetical protein
LEGEVNSLEFLIE